ncbi:hypothetical protein [Rugosimonospora africana]|uniref:Uncharacterized protein n=1 Tax=Rugosimonospora africana TaxID=556532 RepID=A0A8J3QXN1_9ACTN|nr:hypothetical protein [Rugosimonospora africana]GIH17660.1 hypothetical protein Raf01_58320 [Rugosimonospora africana]
MSQDLVVLTPGQPDVSALLAGMAAAGEELLVLEVADGPVIQLCDAPDGETLRPLLTIEVPVMVAVPGEVRRLLGDEVADRVPTPVWWVEVRAAGEPDSAIHFGWRFADAVVGRLGGLVWSASARPAGSTGVARDGASS